MGFSPSKAEGVKHLLGNLKCMQKTNTNKRNFSLSSSTILAIRIYWLQLLQFGVVLKYEPFSQPLVLLGMFSFLYTHFRYSLGRNSNCFISLPALQIGQAINQFKVLHVSEQDYDHAHARNVQPRL